MMQTRRDMLARGASVAAALAGLGLSYASMGRLQDAIARGGCQHDSL